MSNCRLLEDVPQFKVHVPFDGEPGVFAIAPSVYDGSSTSGERFQEIALDTLGEFLEDCCITDRNNANLVTPSAKLDKAFRNHCEQAGYKPQVIPNPSALGRC